MAKEIRTLFLKEFTKNLILNSKSTKEFFPHHPVKHVFPALQTMQQPITQIQQLNQPAQIIPHTEVMTPSIKPSTIEISNIPSVQTTMRFKPISPYPSTARTLNLPQQPFQKQIIQQPNINIQIQPATIPAINPAIAEIMPVPQPLPQGFNLGKLNPILADNTITTIECAGPGKFIMVKGLGRVASTQINLSEQEIKSIVEIFSKYTKIPLVGGIFKAAIGNLVITAVLSDFVGSRFIINKYTPYSILEQAK